MNTDMPRSVRDELAEVITRGSHIDGKPVAFGSAHDAADAVIAAGWVPPAALDAVRAKALRDAGRIDADHG